MTSSDMTGQVSLASLPQVQTRGDDYQHKDLHRNYLVFFKKFKDSGGVSKSTDFSCSLSSEDSDSFKCFQRHFLSLVFLL